MSSDTSGQSKRKCGVCNLQFEEDEMTSVYMGMGSTQYVCEGCDNESFFHVWKQLNTEESQVYVGNIPFEDLYNSSSTTIINLIKEETDE